MTSLQQRDNQRHLQAPDLSMQMVLAIVFQLNLGTALALEQLAGLGQNLFIPLTQRHRVGTVQLGDLVGHVDLAHGLQADLRIELSRCALFASLLSLFLASLR